MLGGTAFDKDFGFLPCYRPFYGVNRLNPFVPDLNGIFIGKFTILKALRRYA